MNMTRIFDDCERRVKDLDFIGLTTDFSSNRTAVDGGKDDNDR